MMQRYALMLLIAAAMTADAFMTASHYQQRAAFAPSTTTTTTVTMAGFGGAAPKKKGASKKKKDVKLKPKQQWDRYMSDDLKVFDAVRVAVRNDGDWFEVGTIKSKDNAYTEAAVVRQRMLIAEHARRLFPVQFLAKDKLEWAYCATSPKPEGDEEEQNDDEWVLAPNKVEGMPDDVDKQIGFQGLPDLTGFYAFSVKKNLA